MSLTAVRIGAIDLGIGNVLGSIMFNLLILGLDDVFYRQGRCWRRWTGRIVSPSSRS